MRVRDADPERQPLRPHGKIRKRRITDALGPATGTREKGMSKDTDVANKETATSSLREQHVRRVVDAAQESHSAITRRNYLAAWRRFEAWADARIAPLGPRRDSLPSHRSSRGPLDLARAGGVGDRTMARAGDGSWDRLKSFPSAFCDGFHGSLRP